MIFYNYQSPSTEFDNNITPGDEVIGEKESKKVEKYQELKRKLPGCGTKKPSRWYQWLWDYEEVQHRTWIS